MYRRLKAPLSVQIEVTTACGNACVHCYNHWRHDRPAPRATMSSRDARTLVDTLADAEVFDIVVTGGEPLLARETTRALVERAHHHGLGVSLNSSLTDLTPADADWLGAARISSILTSVHGPQDIHDAIVCRSGAFEATVRGIGLARAAGIPVHANMVICQHNKDQVLKTARLCQELGIAAFLATKAAHPEHCAGFAPLALTIGDIDVYVRHMRDARLTMPVELLSTFPLCGLPEAADLALRGRRCLAGVAMLTVSADGTARPCNHTDLAYGNVWTESLRDIWARMDDWRQGRFLPTTCRQCPALVVCGGGCRMEAKTRTGDLAGLDPYARPELLPRLIGALKKREAVPVKAPRVFTVNPCRHREEECSSVLRAQGGAPLLLSPEGTRVWTGFEPGQTYCSDDPAIRWGNVDPNPFLAALARKKLITTQEDAS